MCRNLPMLALDNVTLHRGNTRVLDAVSLTVDEGELVALIGANGAGKTTVLRTISGLLRPTSGVIAFRGKAIQATDSDAIVRLGIAHCPEERKIWPQMSVQEHLELGAFIRSDSDVGADMQRIFDTFPVLKERRQQLAGTLSGGQQQMLAIGRALMGRPILLLLDEPSVGIAHRLKMEIFQSIRAIRDAGTAVLLVEQDAGATLAIADRVYVMEHGKFAREGTPKALAADDEIRRVYLGV